MGAFCIPKENIKNLQEAFKKLGDNGIETLMKMSREKKVSVFKSTLPNDQAELFVDGLEKAFADKKLRAFGDYLKNNLDEGKNAKAREKLESEISFIGKNFKDMKEVDSFIQSKTRSIAEREEGLSLSDDEVKEVLSIGKRIEEANKTLSKTKKIEDGKLSEGFKKALSEQLQAEWKGYMFLQNKARVSWAETLNSHLKALLLLSPKSIAVNIMSNKEKSLFSKGLRRLSSRKWNGYNGELAHDLAETMYQVSQDTSETIFGKKIGVGVDLSRSLDLDSMFKKNIIGERLEVGRDTWFTRLVYETGLGRADYHSARISFVDTLNLESSKMADLMSDVKLGGMSKAEKARDIMLDAFDLVPITEEGKMLRQRAVQSALHDTWTDNRILSSFLLGVREKINKITFSDKIGIKVGDLMEAFVKTPANIIQFGTDISGVGLGKSAYKFLKLKKNKGILTAHEAENLFSGALRDLFGSIGGIGAAFTMASMIDDADFVGAYDPNRLKYDELRNSNTNSVKLFGHWVSLDYNILATPLVAMLYAKKYGNQKPTEMLNQYSKGVGSQITKAPVISTFTEMALDFNRKFDTNSDVNDTYKFLGDTLVDQVSSRIPSLLQDIAYLFDDKKRDTTKVVDKFLAKIPGFSKMVPEKYDILGEEIKTEVGGANTDGEKLLAGFFQIMAGARVKKVKESAIGNEVIRMKNSGNAVTITDWKYRLPPKLVKLKEKKGDEEFRRIFKEEYGVKLRESFKVTIESPAYKAASDENKKKLLDKKEDVIINTIYSKHGVK